MMPSTAAAQRGDRSSWHTQHSDHAPPWLSINFAAAYLLVAAPVDGIVVSGNQEMFGPAPRT
jgi:hypothetical protein